MTTFIELLPLELREITDYREPPYELEKSDHEVGVMTEDLKKLFTLWNNTMHSTITLKAELQFGNVANEKESSMKLDELVMRVDVLQRIFWFCVRAEYELWDKDSVGVRRGFVVVWGDRDPNDSPFRRFLEGL